MNVKFGSIAVCLLWANLTYAQDFALPTAQPKPKGRLQLADLYIQTGMFHYIEAPLGLADYRLLAPNSVLLKQDFSSYNNPNYPLTVSSGHFSMLAGINFREKPNWQLRVGFSQSSEYLSNLNLYKWVNKPYDTLTSAQTGQQILVDSVYRTSYHFRHERQMMRVEASLIYRTNPERRWGFYAGIGVSVNLSLNSKTTITEYQDAYTEQKTNAYNTPRYFSYISTELNNKTEQFTNKNSVGYSFFTPLGVDFRVGKKHPLWSRVHLTYEIRPMVQVSSVNGLQKFSDFALQHNIGLRLRLGK
jgi:hypothetical protein